MDHVLVVNSTIFAATFGGVSMSADGGASWKTATAANGLASNEVFGVYASSP